MTKILMANFRFSAAFKNEGYQIPPSKIMCKYSGGSKTKRHPNYEGFDVLF